MPATSAGMTSHIRYWQNGISLGRSCAQSSSADVQRFGARGFPGRIESDLLDPRLGLAQQFLAAALECFAALVDRDRLLEWHLALLEPLDDRFKLVKRPFERQRANIAIGTVGHDPHLFGVHGSHESYL